MKQKSFINKSIIVLIPAFLFLIMLGLTFANDEKGKSDPPPYKSKAEIYSKILATGDTVWHTDVNSSCSYSDHYINIDIDVEPNEIKDAKITMTNWDVDYNDPQSCSGGPEVDYLYVNNN